MTTPTTVRTSRIVHRIAAIWAELDHANRRMLEIQTGTTGLTRRPHNRIR